MDVQRDFATGPAALFAEAVSIMARLRAPGGCPWDREQTFESIQPYTLEETYEVFDAIERQHWQDLCEELGDLLLQVLFYAQMAAETGRFTIADVIAGLNGKLIRRHPHVFDGQAIAGNGSGENTANAAIDSAQVLRNWDAIKQAEKADRPESGGGISSLLDAIPRSLPALLEARKLGSRAGRNGFDWPDTGGLFDKLEEEAAELRQAIETEKNEAGKIEAGKEEPAGTPEERSSRHAAATEAVVSEVGDLLFTMVNLARHLKVDPEFALRHTNAKFRRRFATMEADSLRRLKDLPARELESLWEKAKKAEQAVEGAAKEDVRP
jgi:nucleoside triphosphate diphosphatase